MDIIRKAAFIFKSGKLAVVLILLIIILSIIGTHIPQRSQLKPDTYNNWKNNHPQQAEIFEKIGFTNLFSSVIFLSVAFLLFINTAFCSRDMLARAYQKLDDGQFRKKQYITGLENKVNIRKENGSQNLIYELKAVLKAMGYNISSRENCIFAHKNRFGVFGIPVFHFSILFIIAAVVYGNMGRMEGDMRLIEGQTLSEDHGNYMFINEGPFFNEGHKKFDITLEKFYADYYDETGTERGNAAKISIKEKGQEKKTDMVYSNHLMTYEGYTFLGNVYGMAPLLILRNPDGTVFSGSYITASDPDNSGRYIADFELGETGLEGSLMVYMTADLTSWRIDEKDADREPILFLKIFDKGNVIFDGTLRLNDTIKISDKYLGFYDVKYWSNFYIVKDDGTAFVYAGIGILVLGLFMSFFMVPKKIWIEVVKNENNCTEIYIGGRADKFRSLYNEEFDDIVNRIKMRILNGAN